MTHGSLFSGIGGFDIAAEWCGLQNVWNCEILLKSRSILKKISQNAKQYTDIRECHPGYADIISGGFPCQDISVAGKQQGIASHTRSGLWMEFYRIIREVRPRYVVVENVANLINNGIGRVLADLSACGYHAEWRVLSCEQFGLPHKRERLFIVAYTDQNRRKTRSLFGYKQIKKIFTETPNVHDLSLFAKRFYELADCESIRVDDGVSDFAYRIGAIGNSVSPIVAKYVFDCILNFEREL